MIVQKVLNNSLVLSMDDDSREVIVMGKGIGFNSRPGDEIAPEKIEKLFVTQALGAR
ncbi:TPA: CAT RNA binding domain-containing protein, partial [Klebsiella michiganensis]